VGDAVAPAVHEPLGRRRHGAAREPLSADRRRHAGVAGEAGVPEDTGVPHLAYRADYGPDFNTKGIVSKEPPAIGSAFPVLVPQVDADGNELAGVRVPELAVPVATYTGWNLFNERSGPTDVVSSMQGSFIPLAATKADRERTGDPRKAVEERYEGRGQFLARITKAATDLADQRYLLPADVSRIVDQAGTRWDLVAARSSSR
jgi:hypothetical protein